MDQATTPSSIKPQYLLIKVEKAEPLPDWLSPGNWYRYTIRQGGSDIDGYKMGSLKSVTEYAEIVTADLNERVTNRKYSAQRSKGKPAAPAENEKKPSAS